MAVRQSGGDLRYALGRLGTIVLENQRPSFPYGVPHILIIDDITQIVELNAEVLLAGASNRKPDLNILL